MAEENRFLQCVKEYRQEQNKDLSRCLSYNPDNRFERAYAEHKGYAKPLHTQSYTTENRFDCLRNTVPDSKASETQRVKLQQCASSYSEYGTPIPFRQMNQRSSSYSEYDTREQPKKSRTLTIDDTEHFPSLPSSPGSLAPKTPKTPMITPLREEFEFIPLPKSQTSDTTSLCLSGHQTVLSEQNNSQQQQYYQVVKKVTGGSWSDRLKLSLEMQRQQEEEDVEGLEYDEDGFPVLRSIRDMVS